MIPKFKTFYQRFLDNPQVANDIVKGKPEGIPLKDILASFYVRDLLLANVKPNMIKLFMPESLHHIIKTQYEQLLTWKIKTVKKKLCFAWYEILPSLREARKSTTNPGYYDLFPERGKRPCCPA